MILQFGLIPAKYHIESEKKDQVKNLFYLTTIKKDLRSILVNILYSNQNHRIKHDEFITNKNTPHHGMIFCLDSIESTNSIIQSSVISSWSNPVIPSLLPIQTFAQTRFGSLKIKHTERTIKLNIFR